jgi:hypothetical protein
LKKNRRPEQPVPETLQILDFGREVHLWIEQRVPWDVALQILQLLTQPHEAETKDTRPCDPAPPSRERG